MGIRNDEKLSGLLSALYEFSNYTKFERQMPWFLVSNQKDTVDIVSFSSVLLSL